MTTEADEVVQEAFVRAIRAAPDPSRPLRPWLVRVTVNLARDRLRRRRRASYAGAWLPQPVADDAPGAELLEAVSYALLVALERLTPTQRAVWLLREVMDLDTAEAADVLEVQPGSVKVALHRARRALDGAASEPVDPATGLAAVGALAQAILAGDVAAVVELLADDVVATSDGGGVFHAARVPVVGAERVARLLIGLAHKAPDALFEAASVGGLPGVWVRWPTAPDGFAPASLSLFDVRDGRVVAVYTVLEPGKLPASRLRGTWRPFSSEVP